MLGENALPINAKDSVFFLREKNKAGYTAQDAPSMRSKITRDGPTDGRTDGHNLL